MMDEEKIIQKTVDYVKKELGNDRTGHDWWHTERVWKLALRITEEEKEVDLFVIQMAALLHDLGDYKLHGGDTTAVQRIVGKWLDNVGVTGEKAEHIMNIVDNMSFSKSLEDRKFDKTKEFEIVQDADRLEAIGAIGIARCFFYTGTKNGMIYDPLAEKEIQFSSEKYRNITRSSINHFYDKLLKLRDLMNTDFAKKIAQQRQEFMEDYLKQFFNEWEVKV